MTYLKRLALTVIFALFIVALGHQSALAEDVDVGQAKTLFKEGNTLYRQGRFKQALTKFKNALKLSRRPNIILNIGQCYRQLEQPRQAIFFYRLYLSEARRHKPGQKPRYSEEVARHIQAMEVLNKEQEKRRRDHQLSRAVTQTPPGQTVQKIEETPFYKSWWFWTAVGAVAVGGTITGVALAGRGTDPGITGSAGKWEF